MKSKRIVIGIAAVTTLALMMSSVYASTSCPPGLSPGFWKHNVKVYCGGPGHYSSPEEGMDRLTDTDMLNYATAILGFVNPYGITIPDSAKVSADAFLHWANGILQDPTNPMWLNLANAFNSAAGRAPYLGD